MNSTLASNIVTRALEKALKQDSTNSPFTDSENNIAMDELNDMMFEWDSAFDINIGYFEVVILNDETNIPKYAASAVKNNLAFRLSTEFGREISQGFALAAKDSLDALLTRIIVQPCVSFPSTLPTGSGQYHHNGRHFFDDQTLDDLETESGAAISTNRNFPLEVDTIPTDPDKT